MSTLTDYIQTQLNNGYASSQIKQYLIQQGYNQKDVQTAFDELSRAGQQVVQQAPSVQQGVVQSVQSGNSQLSSSIMTYLQQGYRPDQVFDYLKNNGYSEDELNTVFSQINNQYYQGRMQFSTVHEHAVSSSSVVKIGLMLVFVFLIIGGGFFVMQNRFGSSNDKLLDVTTTPIKTKLLEGDVLGFNVDLISQGAEGRVDAFFEYIIRDSNSKLILKETDTKAFDTTMSFQRKLILPEMETGLYSLHVIARYDGKMADSTFTFSYQANAEDVAPDIPEKPINTVNEIVETTKDESVKTPQPKPAKGSKGKSDQDLFDEAIRTNNDDIALGYCVKISDEDLLTECYYTVAQQNQDNSVCDLITNINRKEDCYMNFVMSGDGELCSKVTLSENKVLCNQFVQLETIHKYLDSEDDDGLQSYLNVSESGSETDDPITPDTAGLDDFSIDEMVT